MTPQEIDRAIEVIREYCKSADCLNCDYSTLTGCIFTDDAPYMWKTLEETESEKGGE